MTEIGTFSGRHVLAEFDGIDARLLDDAAFLQETLRSVVTEAGATVCQVVTHRFEPHGVTALALLAESHASLHTYPELGTAFADVFTCGERADPELAVRLLAEALKAGGVRSSTTTRGRGSRPVSEPVGTGLTRSWDVSEVIIETRTDFQNLLIGRTAQGVSLFCDGERQSTEATQLTYHEALMVPAMLLADRIRRVLIIGSSEGVASQLAVAAGAEVVDHVDIDRVTVRACAENLPYGYTPEELAAAERGEGPVRVHYRDGWEFLAQAEPGYDVVVIDLPDENDDPEAQHNRLYGTEFLQRCAALLAPGGVVSCQAGCPTMWRNDTLITAWRRFKEAFGTVLYYGSDEHEWAFLSARADDAKPDLAVKLAALPYRPETIDADALRGNTVPPRLVRASGLPGRGA
ncbi:adenosylmethionine decarboxylase [Amycolatopsis rhizosphaerae]|uniref:S-adenosylmethionine decarboxylase proenzyme n=1 Tax=Amycolatopsis rhizosphaerae TaxID=2053003 RepID=A0A558CE62_9PSEU|nr:adenosylmethionine decarboxylase [Amycolatopsis rhizosphaerae]